MAAADDFCIVTLNTWKASGDYRRRLTLMADGLRALAPDIVLLQEAIAAPAVAVDTGEHLARHLGFSHLHHPARAKRRVVLGHRMFSTTGLSLLSRWPIVRTRAVTLPADPHDGERIAQIATLTGPFGALIIVNVNLTPLAGADLLRQRQLDAVMQAFQGWPLGDAAIFGGDFGCEPHSPPLSWLRSASGVVAEDAWHAAGGPQPTLTTVDGRHPGRRCVDHLFIMTQRPPRTAQWSSAARVLDARDPVSDTYASDHFGVCGRVTWLP
jgi:endonuclease/exonuclease/phosphatase family metal-dependent hydrolase